MGSRDLFHKTFPEALLVHFLFLGYFFSHCWFCQCFMAQFLLSCRQLSIKWKVERSSPWALAPSKTTKEPHNALQKSYTWGGNVPRIYYLWHTQWRKERWGWVRQFAEGLPPSVGKSLSRRIRCNKSWAFLPSFKLPLFCIKRLRLNKRLQCCFLQILPTFISPFNYKLRIITKFPTAPCSTLRLFCYKTKK